MTLTSVARRFDKIMGPPDPDVVDARVNFEMVGADYIVDDDRRAWLLEVNAGPVMKEQNIDMARGIVDVSRRRLQHHCHRTLYVLYRELSMKYTGRCDNDFNVCA